MKKLSYQDIVGLVEEIDVQFRNNFIYNVYGIPNGGIVPAVMYGLMRNVPVLHNPAEISKNTLVIDDILDSGSTIERYNSWQNRAVLIAKKKLKGVKYAVLQKTNEWVQFPWENKVDETAGVADNIRRILQFIGEDCNRDGLIDTPNRVAKSYTELFAGYQMKEQEILSKVFDSDYDQIVILKNIEFYSMCEHHMLPFFGKVSIGYIPNGKVVGISKLARLVEMYSRRLQIQEQLTEQIADAIVKELKPKGVGVTIEAQHFCMVARGVSKQSSSMVTSKLRGAMLKEPEARAEYYKLINGI